VNNVERQIRQVEYTDCNLCFINTIPTGKHGSCTSISTVQDLARYINSNMSTNYNNFHDSWPGPPRKKTT
jgi:hypothetical protein